MSLLEVVEGPVEFVDTRNNKRQGKVHLKPSGVVMAGVPLRAALSGAVRGALIAGSIWLPSARFRHRNPIALGSQRTMPG